jgi:hypothetical protein
VNKADGMPRPVKPVRQTFRNVDRDDGGKADHKGSFRHVCRAGFAGRGSASAASSGRHTLALPSDPRHESRVAHLCRAPLDPGLEQIDAAEPRQPANSVVHASCRPAALLARQQVRGEEPCLRVGLHAAADGRPEVIDQ